MKVYVSRDEADDWVWLWKKPDKGVFKPQKRPDCPMTVFERPWTMDDMSAQDAYTVSDFEKKFNKKIKNNKMQSMDIPDKLVNSEDYKLFSNKGDRKK